MHFSAVWPFWGIFAILARFGQGASFWVNYATEVPLAEICAQLACRLKFSAEPHPGLDLVCCQGRSLGAIAQRKSSVRSSKNYVLATPLLQPVPARDVCINGTRSRPAVDAKSKISLQLCGSAEVRIQKRSILTSLKR
jgi:hypothetical protein